MKTAPTTPQTAGATLAPAAAAFALLVAAACGGSPVDPDDGRTGSFLRFDFTGDAAGHFEGTGADSSRSSYAVVLPSEAGEGHLRVEARSAVPASSSDHLFSLQLGAIDGPAEVDLPAPLPLQPSAGFDDIVPSFLALALEADAPRTSFVVTDGTLTISELSDGWMEGEFTARLRHVDRGTGEKSFVELTDGGFRLRMP